MTRRQFLKLMAAGAASTLAGAAMPRRLWAQPPPASHRLPNIVVIIADDLGRSQLGYDGGTMVPTPHIDSIAAKGVRFTHAYVTCPLCSPSRQAILTGRYPQRSGHEFNLASGKANAGPHGMPRTELTLAERLKPLGYATGIVGKWHLGSTEGLRPTDRGFDEFFGFYGGQCHYLPELRPPSDNPIRRGTGIVPEAEYLTDAFGREACAFIDRHRTEPFLLYLPVNAIHGPWEATQDRLARFAGLKGERAQLYAGTLSALDDNVGRVLGKLREHGLEGDTLVVFVSDNGGIQERAVPRTSGLRGGKGELWEGGIRVPALMQWPGHIPAGVPFDKPVSSLDIAPTALAATGQTVPASWELDGVDLLSWFERRRTGRPHEALFWRMGAQRAVQAGDWKLVEGVGRPGLHLYDLDGDPGEGRDLAAEMPGRVEELTARWVAWNSQMAPPAWVRVEGGGQAAAAAPPVDLAAFMERRKPAEDKSWVRPAGAAASGLAAVAAAALGWRAWRASHQTED